jgi:hypothetical protein
MVMSHITELIHKTQYDGGLEISVPFWSHYRVAIKLRLARKTVEVTLVRPVCESDDKRGEKKKKKKKKGRGHSICGE